jgi:hypothetical protein
MSKPKSKLDARLITALYILGVLALGLFAINQTLTYFYNAQFLKSPCTLCADLNKNQSKCIENCFTYEERLYPDGHGNFRVNGVPLSNVTFNLTRLET